MAEAESREAQLRRWASRLGLSLRKARPKGLNLDPEQKYILKDIDKNLILKGAEYRLSLDDVEQFLREYEVRIQPKQSR